eukprot:gb/GEZN01012401.1/.p1 GENE.gb/GEZN01012401.1/~~gb/GEZN01012401.1/.p1  ORF type:complete len:228 (+),score=17.30 gb/GEZN01012401.1/:55-738(+)
MVVMIPDAGETDSKAIMSPFDMLLGDNENEDSKNSMASPEEVFSRPMLYYRKRGPLERANTKAAGPTQLVLPDKQVALLFEEGANSEHENELLDENMVVFSSPATDLPNRSRISACIVVFLFPADFFLVTMIYIDSTILGENVQPVDNYPGMAFAAAVIMLSLGLLGWKLQETRILTLFIVLFYVDALINLIRVANVVHFTHFVLQIVICQIVRQYKLTLMADWVSP